MQRLQDAKVIREVMYPIWLANTVPVKKKQKLENVCGFHRFDKACKKDDYPLERVDKVVDDQQTVKYCLYLTCSQDTTK